MKMHKTIKPMLSKSPFNPFTRTQCPRAILAAVAAGCLAASGFAHAQTVLAESNFQVGDEGWTQLNLGGDYRYPEVAEVRTDCPGGGTAGTLTFCDPDNGEWMFNAPAKFLGDKSAALDGYIEFSSGDWNYGGDLDTDPYPNVAFISGSVAIVLLNQSPALDQWTTYHYELSERDPWLWVDDDTPMDDLPKATRAQIQQVLGNVTTMLIRGEAITGDDEGSLDNVTLVSAGIPTLRIGPTNDHVVVSWPLSATNYVLETSAVLPGQGLWTTVNTQTNWHEFTPGGHDAFFRLRRL